MKGWLLDVNALLALAWPSHVHHALVQDWLARHQTKGWATCAVTQLGFVRLSSQPAFSPHHKTPAAAVNLLRQFTAMKHHAFWPEPSLGFDAPGMEALIKRILTHHHITDGWLAAVAQANRGRLATLDEALSRLFPDVVELIR